MQLSALVFTRDYNERFECLISKYLLNSMLICRDAHPKHTWHDWVYLICITAIHDYVASQNVGFPCCLWPFRPATVLYRVDTMCGFDTVKLNCSYKNAKPDKTSPLPQLGLPSENHWHWLILSLKSYFRGSVCVCTVAETHCLTVLSLQHTQSSQETFVIFWDSEVHQTQQFSIRSYSAADLGCFKLICFDLFVHRLSQVQRCPWKWLRNPVLCNTTGSWWGATWVMHAG